MRMSPCRSPVLAAVLGSSVLCSSALAALPSEYSFVGTPSLPAGAWDVAPDGRIIAVDGTSIVRQNAVGGAAFTTIGSVPVGTVSDFGASFLSVSPDGSTIALGDNGFDSSARVHLVSTDALSTAAPTATTSVPAPNYAAAWASNSQLFVSGGLFGSPALLTRIDLSPSLAATTGVNSIPDASGGVAVYSGSVFTGVGFGPREGEIRSFAIAALASAASPVAFNSGSPVATILSAATINFDLSGNLIVAGSGGVTITNLSGSSITFAPLGAGAFYTADYNPVTGQVLVQGTDFASGASGAFAYAVPAPASAALLALGMLAPRRQRRGA